MKPQRLPCLGGKGVERIGHDARIDTHVYDRRCGQAGLSWWQQQCGKIIGDISAFPRSLAGLSLRVCGCAGPAPEQASAYGSEQDNSEPRMGFSTEIGGARVSDTEQHFLGIPGEGRQQWNSMIDALAWSGSAFWNSGRGATAMEQYD